MRFFPLLEMEIIKASSVEHSLHNVQVAPHSRLEGKSRSCDQYWSLDFVEEKGDIQSLDKDDVAGGRDGIACWLEVEGACQAHTEW